MDEAQIVERLKQNITPPPDTVLTTTTVTDTTNGQATVAPEYKTDELLTYRLHEFFDSSFHSSNTQTKSQVEYIHQKIVELTGVSDYNSVVAKIIEVERELGILYDSQRLYKLYQWLKLDTMRQNINKVLEEPING